MTTKNDTTSNLQQVQNLQIRLSEVASIARLADEQFGDDADISGPFSIIERELDQIRGALDDLIRDGERQTPEAKSRSQGTINRSRLADAINAVVAMSEDEADSVIDAVLGVLAPETPPPDEDDGILPKVDGDLMTAVDLCKTVRVFLAETHDDDGMTAATVVEQIESAIRKAWDRIDNEDIERRWASETLEAATSLSGGIDDLTLTLERAQALVTAIVDVDMHGEERDLVSLGSILRREIETADGICRANSKQWGAA